jgi:membrane-associated phospholipid phosphatase
MKKNTFLYKVIFTIGCTFCFHLNYGQDSLVTEKKVVYKLKPWVDIPIVTACAAWSGYMLTQIYSKGPSTTEQILSLNVSSIDPLDRLAIYPYNAKMDKMSYYPFYAAFPLPIALLLTGKRMRSDFLKIGFLYLESLSITGFVGGSATYFVNQYRPYVYTLGTPMDRKTSQNAKNAFYAGHVEVVAVSTFFISEVYANYYPESKIKWMFFVLAAAATAGMGYLRIDAGMHFPSDVLLGSCTGALSGILVPYFHNHKIIRNADLSLSPFGSATSQGISMTYKFNK